MTTTPGTTAAGDLSRGTSRRVSHERAPAPSIRMTQPRYEIGVDTGGIESLQLPTCFAAGSSHPLTGLQRFAHFRFCEAGTYRMLERVWQEKYTALRSIVRSFLFDDARVEDILQDALSRVLASGRSFPDELETYRYLRRAVLTTTAHPGVASTCRFQRNQETSRSPSTPALPTPSLSCCNKSGKVSSMPFCGRSRGPWPTFRTRSRRRSG